MQYKRFAIKFLFVEYCSHEHRRIHSTPLLSMHHRKHHRLPLSTQVHRLERPFGENLAQPLFFHGSCACGVVRYGGCGKATFACACEERDYARAPDMEPCGSGGSMRAAAG